jgi:hypothetical protein
VLVVLVMLVVMVLMAGDRGGHDGDDGGDDHDHDHDHESDDDDVFSSRSYRTQFQLAHQTSIVLVNSCGVVSLLAW